MIMTSKNKKLFIYLIFVLIIGFGFRGKNIYAATILDSGTCWSNIEWELDSDYTLTLNGSGPLVDFSSPESTPWYKYCNSINKIVVKQIIWRFLK